MKVQTKNLIPTMKEQPTDWLGVIIFEITQILYFLSSVVS